MNKFFKDRLPIFIFIIIIFILGICFGAVAVNSVGFEVKDGIFKYFNSFMQGYDQIEYNQGNMIGESIQFNLMNIFIFWAFGLSMILMPIIPILVFFKGFVLGFTVGFLMSEFGFKGILIAVTAVFPQNILIIPVYLLSSVMAIYISIRIFKYYRGNLKIKFEELLSYTLEMLILSGVLLLASLLETYLSPLLMKLVI
ncbi:MAG: stage II sporulation protein M, partial [bacterium]